MSQADAKTPAPVMGIYDRKMWESIANRQWHLQCCKRCGAFQYPPAPGCAACLSMELRWQPVSGDARIISWTIFHKQYLPAYPVPYNVIAVRLAEGPVFISNLEGPVPAGSWIGEKVSLVYVTMPDGFILPRFRLQAGAAEHIAAAK